MQKITADEREESDEERYSEPLGEALGSRRRRSLHLRDKSERR